MVLGGSDLFNSGAPNALYCTAYLQRHLHRPDVQRRQARGRGQPSPRRTTRARRRLHRRRIGGRRRMPQRTVKGDTLAVPGQRHRRWKRQPRPMTAGSGTLGLTDGIAGIRVSHNADAIADQFRPDEVARLKFFFFLGGGLIGLRRPCVSRAIRLETRRACCRRPVPRDCAATLWNRTGRSRGAASAPPARTRPTPARILQVNDPSCLVRPCSRQSPCTSMTVTPSDATKAPDLLVDGHEDDVRTRYRGRCRPDDHAGRTAARAWPPPQPSTSTARAIPGTPASLYCASTLCA